MRDRRADLCPRCGSKFKPVRYSGRRYATGVWWEVQCPECALRKTVFKPHRK